MVAELLKLPSTEDELHYLRLIKEAHQKLEYFNNLIHINISNGKRVRNYWLKINV